MPRKASKTNSNAEGSKNVSNSTAIGVSQSSGPIRGGSSTRGAKRRRTSNNVNSNSTEIYGSGTIVAANPFDDDHHHPLPLSNSSTTSTKMMVLHPQHHMQQQHLQQQASLQHQPQLHHGLQQSSIQQQHHQMYAYPSNNYLQQPMSIPPSHSHNQMGTPPGQAKPPPSHSPYMHHQQAPPISQQGSIHAPPLSQEMTSQSPHLEQMLVQQQSYPINHNASCGKCMTEIFPNQTDHIICKAGCGACFHVSCSGLTIEAFNLLMKEHLAEWACDNCTSGNRRVPLVKYI